MASSKEAPVLATPTTTAVLPVAVVGAAVLPLVGRPGRVHSVFRRALNLELGDGLVAVVAGRTGRLPHGLHLDRPADFAELGVVPDASVSWVDRRIGVGGALELDLTGAAVWSDRCLAVPLAAADRLGSRLRRTRASVPASQLLVGPCRALARALRAGDPIALRCAV